MAQPCSYGAGMQAEIARVEKKELNDKVLDLTRKEVSLAQDVKDLRHELTAERSAVAADVAAADARLEASQKRVQEAEGRVAELESSWRDATAARDEVNRKAEAAEGEKKALASKLQTLKVCLNPCT